MAIDIGRRQFISVLSGAAAAWPLVARAQQAKVPVIGFLGTTSQSTWSQPVAAFEQRLSELGWVVGRTINIDYRWTEGRNEQAPAIAEAFVQRKVDIIVAGGNAVAAAKQATTSIPIVFPVAVDPVGSGFVDNLSRPGGNVTGLSLQGPDVAGKRLELLRQMVPGLRRLAIMVDVGYPAAKKDSAECQTAARDRWIAARRKELLPTPYVHVVFTLPRHLAPLVLQNKKVIYDLLFRSSAQTLLEIARNPQHLGAEIGFFSVLHTCLLWAYGPRNLMKIFQS